jgi:hypothetical protein
MAAYDDPGEPSRFEYDHLVPLSLGGAVNDPHNMWPEPDYPTVSPNTYVLNPKDELEERLHDRVCLGQVPLSEAQLMVARDWLAAYRKWGG